MADRPPSGSETVRVAVAYAVAACPAGVFPFAALWLNGQGAPMASLGLLLALPLMARVLAARPLAAWAGRFAAVGTPVSVLCAVAALAGGMTALPNPPLWLCVGVWWGVCFSIGACTPLMDTAIMGTGLGEPRLFQAKGAGALTYIAANIGVGWLFKVAGLATMALWLGVTAGLAALLLPRLLPPVTLGPATLAGAPPETVPASSGRRWGLVAALTAAALIETSHGFNSMAMIAWGARGFGPDLSGLLWAIGIMADVAFLWGTRGFCRRIGPARLLVLGGMGAVIRWMGLGTAPPLALLILFQALHALSFTATALAAIQLIHHLSDGAERLRMQTLNWSLSSGLCTGVGALAAGPLYDALGVRGYWIMAGLAGVGLVLAFVMCRRQATGTDRLDAPSGVGQRPATGRWWLRSSIPAG